MNLGNIAGVMQMVYQTTNQTQRQAVNGSSFTDKLQEAKGETPIQYTNAYIWNLERW